MEDGGPSETARRVAAHRIRFTREVTDYGDPAADEALAADLVDGQAAALLARTGWAVVIADGKSGGGKPDAGNERSRTAGLLTATAGPRSARAPASGSASGPRPATRPRRSAPSSPAASRPSRPAREGSPPLSALLSQALVAFTIEFDNEAEHVLPHRTTSHGASRTGDGPWLVSLVMYENCMRYVTAEPITVGALLARARTGTNLDGMRRWGYVTIDGTARKIHPGKPGPDAVLRATTAGLRARAVWAPLPDLIEQRWRDRFGDGAAGAVRAALEPLAAGPEGAPPPLFGGMRPHPDNWRAGIRPPVTLPHYPMVLHRGGYPDGS